MTVTVAEALHLRSKKIPEQLPAFETGGWDARVIPALPESESHADGPSETAIGELPKPPVRTLDFVPQTFQQMH